jgi:hypothetical protein
VVSLISVIPRKKDVGEGDSAGAGCDMGLLSGFSPFFLICE